MAHLGEGRERRAAHALGGRIAADQLRMLGFQRLEFVEQAIVFGVGDARLVEDVVAVVVLIQLSAQLKNAGFDGGHDVLSKSKRAA